MDDRLHARIESIRIRGFRSLAEVKVTDLPPVAVLIGANGSGKSNVMRFFEMLGWMLRSSRLGDFVQMQGGADDQLFHGRRRTPQMAAELRLATETGHNDYRFVLAHAHPDRFIFLEEAYRFSNRTRPTLADWQYIGSGNAEAGIVAVARAQASPQQKTASVVVNLLRNCVTYQFHDTSDESRFKQSWDVTDNGFPAQPRRQPGGGAPSPGNRGERPVPVDLPARRPHPAGFRPLCSRGAIREGLAAMVDQALGQDVRCPPDIRRFAAVLCAGNPA